MAAAAQARVREGRGEVIREVVRSLHGLFHAVDVFSRRALEEFGVTGPQIWALRTIREEEGLTIGGLSERMYLHISTVSGILDRLEGRGFVVRERGGEDRRRVRLRLTPPGRALLGRVPEPPRSMILRGLQRLPDRELDRMRSSIRRLRRIMRIGDGGFPSRKA